MIRQRRRRTGRGKLIALALLIVAGIDALAHAGLVVLLLAAVVVCVLLVIRRNYAPGPAPDYAHDYAPAITRESDERLPDHREVPGLLAEIDQLRAALRDAEIARDAAWDASASRPPATPPRPAKTDQVECLLADPRAGVRPLHPRDPS